jgi:hypothetical protein
MDMAKSFVFDVANSLLGKLASSAYEQASRAKWCVRIFPRD